MKEFFKENIIRILCLMFVSLLLVSGCRILTYRVFKTASFENLIDLNDRVRCAESLGWYVDKSSETVKSIYIPNEKTKEFIEYNEMQKLCGFDLLPYMGKGANVYTYRITNFPYSSSVNAFLNLIIYDEKLIGGDCDVLEFDDLYLPVSFKKTDAYISGVE